MGNSTRHTGRWTLEDRFAAPWHYLPVEVGPGTAGLRVALDYERASGTVLDLGCLGPNGFRGWSGNARESFLITSEAATPGYLPGELEAGTWQVMIGVHRVPPDGVRYQLTAEAIGSLPLTAGAGALTTGAVTTGAWAVGAELRSPPAPPSPVDRPARRLLPASEGRHWLAGDLHAHTVHSDGVLTVSELAATDGGHAGVLGDVGWIDFRRPPDDWLDATEAGGGLLSINHPFAGPVSWVHPMRRRPPLVEVWHWSWLDLRWTTPLGWWQAWDPTATPVGGSDWHRPGSDAPLGRPTTWVQCAGTEPGDVLDGLRAGLVAISAERDGPVLLRHEGDFVAIDADGLTLAGPQGPCARIRGERARLTAAPGPHRLLDASGATLALTP